MASSQPRQISVYFRYDDYAANTPFDLEKRVVDGFRKNSCSFTVGIIPHVTSGHYRDLHARGNLTLSSEKIEFAREAIKDGTVDPALHGYEHKTVHANTPHSEFQGLAYQIQYEKLKKGAVLFENYFDQWPKSFIPPWNTYDNHTLKALETLNINSLSANRYGPVSAGNIFFVPITIEHQQLWEALQSAQNLRWADITIGVLLHPYDFHESGDCRSSLDANQLGKLLKRINDLPNTRVLSLSQLNRHQPSLDFRRYRANKPSALEYVAPPYIKKTYSSPFYLPTKAAIQNQYSKLLQTLVFFLVVMAVAAFGGITVQKILVGTGAIQVTDALRFATLGAALAVGIHTLRTKHLYFKAGIAYAAITGMLISFFFL